MRNIMSLSRTELKNQYKQYCLENKYEPVKCTGIARIATYNIHYWTDLYDKPAADKILSDINKINADVLCLQEVSFDRTMFNHYNYDQLIKKFSDMGYLYSIEVYGSRYLNAKYGNMIFSKWPITNIKSGSLPLGQTKVMRAYCMGKIIHLDLNICCLHLDVFDETGRTRTEQINKLIMELNMPSDNLIICGDFNCIRQEELTLNKDQLAINKMNQIIEDDLKRGIKTDISTLLNLNKIGYQTCFDQSKQQNPYSTVWSGRTIDFIFVPHDFIYEVDKSYIYHTINSDHCSIYMDIKNKSSK